MAFAPLRLAMVSPSRAPTAWASWFTPLWIRVSSARSRNMFRALLLAALSVPRATFTPAAMSFGTGATPLASFRLLTGFVATVVPLAAIRAMSLSLSWMQWAATVRSVRMPHRSASSMGVQP